MIGMKGGKNYILESDAAYTLYFLNCLKNKWEYFSKVTKRKIPYSEDINFDIGNASSVGQRQARRAFFSRVQGIIKATRDPKTKDNWFERYAGLDIRETFGDLTAEAIEFPSKYPGQGKIRLYSFNSEPKSPEGYHFFRFYHDEPSRAKTKAEYSEAKAVADLAENNTRVSFPNRVGKFFAWAYPNDTDFDLMVDLYDRSMKDDSVFGERCSTFEFNISITKEMLQDAYNNDPINAARTYECIKPLSRDNFYRPHTEKLEETISKTIENKVKYNIFPITRETEDHQKHNFTGIELTGLTGDSRVRCFAGDYSVNGDRFVMVGGYNQTIDPRKMNIFLDEKWEVIDTNIKPVIDVMIVIEAISDAHPIDYLAAGYILTQLKRAFPNMRTFNTDRMQNEKLRQELISRGVNSRSYSFSRAQQFSIFIKKRWLVWNNNLEICYDNEKAHKIKIGSREYSPGELWLLEGQKLIRDGTKIDHPNEYSKDVQDAVAICANDLLKLEAEDSGMRASSLNEMTDEQFRELVYQYLDLKYELEKAELPEEIRNKKISEQLHIEEREIKIIEERAKEIYGAASHE